MKEATLGQGVKVLSLIEQKEIPREQLQKLIASGFLSDLLDANVDGIDRDVFRQSIGLNPFKPKPLLNLLGTVTVSAATKKFVAKDWLKVNTGKSASVKISWLGDNLKSWFSAKVEEPIPEITLRYQELRKSSVDAPIIAELGGEAKAETTLAEMFALLERQKNGESGVLLTNGYANVFYIRDVNGVLRAVDARWFGDGWLVDAYFVGDPFRWFDGGRVFSRNS